MLPLSSHTLYSFLVGMGEKLIKEGILPSYLFSLWAEHNGGRTPPQLRRRFWVLSALGFLVLAVTLIATCLTLSHFQLHRLTGCMGYFDAFLILMYAAVVSGLRDGCKAKTQRFNLHMYWLVQGFLELYRSYGKDVTPSLFPPAKEEFLGFLDKSLYEMALEAEKRGGLSTSWSFPAAVFRNMYDAAKAFGGVKNPEKGYAPYFKVAKRKLQQKKDAEEIPLLYPLFHEIAK